MSPMFTAMGSTAGLVLVVKHGRGWLPVNTIKSDVFPVDAALDCQVSGEVLEIADLPYTLRSA